MKYFFTIALTYLLTAVALGQTDITLDNQDGVYFKDNSGATDGTRIFRRSGNSISIQYEKNSFRFDALDNRAVLIKNNLGETAILLHPTSNSTFEVGSLGLGLSAAAIDDDYRLHISRGNQHMIKLENTTNGNGSIAFANSIGMRSRLQFGSEGGFNFSKYDGTSFNAMLSIASDGNVGIGVIDASEKLVIDGNLKIRNGNKFMQHRSNVTTEHILSSHGQGSGWFVNASYDGSGDPQTNATYSMGPGNHNTGAGYLDFDGNAKRWTINIAGTSTGVGDPATFVQSAVFDDSYIALSPTGNEADFRIGSAGEVGIGTDSPSEKLEVNGTIRSKEVKVEATGWPDYVFESDYNLRSLEETEEYIKTNKHLPEIPSAKEMEANGVQLGEMNMLLLKKIEELTLYVIDLKKENEAQQKEIEKLKQDK
ncbi:hypothetical protein [Ekhidna sp. To15]|uniref:hypothetical protein n=1 Tax=Ekhidna sp. To15 TaxID=3395267 RepID=UPI003F52702F